MTKDEYAAALDRFEKLQRVYAASPSPELGELMERSAIAIEAYESRLQAQPELVFDTHGIGPMRAYATVGDRSLCVYRHETDAWGKPCECYSVSENRVWVPGLFASPVAALRAAAMPPDDLAEARRIYGVRPLTLEHLGASC